jgi:signal peptidase II
LYVKKYPIATTRMKNKVFLRNIILSIILCSNLACDQLSKNVAREALSYHAQIKLLGDRLTLVKVENTGAFLSFGDSLPEWFRFLFLILLPLVVLAAGMFYLFSNRYLPKTYAVGLCFVIGGGAGNIYDRLLHGSVTDFLHLDLGLFETGVFNFADVSIMLGMVMLLYQVVLKRKVVETDQDTAKSQADVL